MFPQKNLFQLIITMKIQSGDIVEIIWEDEDYKSIDVGMSGIVLPPLSKKFYKDECYLFIGHLKEDEERVLIEDRRRTIHLFFKDKLIKSEKEFRYN